MNPCSPFGHPIAHPLDMKLATSLLRVLRNEGCRGLPNDNELWYVIIPRSTSPIASARDRAFAGAPINIGIASHSRATAHTTQRFSHTHSIAFRRSCRFQPLLRQDGQSPFLHLPLARGSPAEVAFDGMQRAPSPPFADGGAEASSICLFLPETDVTDNTHPGLHHLSLELGASLQHAQVHPARLFCSTRVRHRAERPHLWDVDVLIECHPPVCRLQSR